MNKIFLSVLLLLPALFPVQGQSWRALQQQAQKRGELASARQIILLDSTAVSVAPSGTGTFTINKVILVQNRSGALATEIRLRSPDCFCRISSGEYLQSKRRSSSGRCR